ncbi:PolC-type DNA polymerase III [Maribacter polysiphoniae]|uniref:3'-5' exonuclease n=1 Tax=Maribacter polysiphoniae TaxID=429344 RepID=UPI00235765EF|nr:3'-5' exonuclease [Maribacter polysiphoniae]
MFKDIFNRHKPEFWKDYTSHFKNEQPQELAAVRFVVFDTETTGLDIVEDRILSIGAISIVDLRIDVGDSLETYVKQDVFNIGTVGIHGILKEGSIHKLSETVAIKGFLDYVENAVLVAHHAAFDIAMINAGLARMGLPKLKNKVLDTGVLFKKTSLCEKKHDHYSLDRLCAVFNLKKHDRHTASGDALLTALIFLKVVSHLSKKRKPNLGDLLFNSDRRGLW